MTDSAGPGPGSAGGTADAPSGETAEQSSSTALTGLTPGSTSPASAPVDAKEKPALSPGGPEQKSPAKEWDWTPEGVAAAHLADCLVQISAEEACLMRGSEEGRKTLSEYKCTTGWILQVNILDTRHQKTLQQEIEALGFAEDWKHAAAIAERLRSTPPGGKAGPRSDMKLDHLAALSLYTSTACGHLVNKTLRHRTDVSRHVNFMANFVQGFRALPSYWGCVYRGLVLREDDLGLYAPGSFVLMRGYTSASRLRSAAKRFAAVSADRQSGATVLCLFVIESRSGRSLEEVSFYPNEQEVAFRPWTTFKVDRFVRESLNTCEVHLVEAHPDIRGRKVLVWVDDRHSFESKRIMDLSERAGVTCVHLHSTEDARDFFDRCPFILERDHTSLRVITDMVRTEEDGKQNIEAGLDLIAMLAGRGYWRQPIMCFTGSVHLGEKQARFVKRGFTHVFVTSYRRDAEVFAAFVPFPTAPFAPSAPSTPSASPVG